MSGNNGQKNSELEKRTNLPAELNEKLQSLRCQNCNRFLLYHAIVEGTVAIVCKKCKTLNIVDAHNLEKIPLDKSASTN